MSAHPQPSPKGAIGYYELCKGTEYVLIIQKYSLFFFFTGAS